MCCSEESQCFFLKINSTFSLFFFSFFLATPPAYGNSQARDQIQTAAVTYTTPAAMLDP